MGEELEPLEVTRALRLPPDRQYRHGEPRLTRSKKGKVLDRGEWQGGLWSMSSRKWVDSPRLETHLAWLLAEFEPRAEAILALLAGEVTGDFFCFSCGATPEPPSLSRVIRARAAALGLKIEIDHYAEAAHGL